MRGKNSTKTSKIRIGLFLYSKKIVSVPFEFINMSADVSDENKDVMTHFY